MPNGRGTPAEVVARIDVALQAIRDELATKSSALDEAVTRAVQIAETLESHAAETPSATVAYAPPVEDVPDPAETPAETPQA